MEMDANIFHLALIVVFQIVNAIVNKINGGKNVPLNNTTRW
jgi:predicted Co/Zn/Cd cation transporter (cation efflux family)